MFRSSPSLRSLVGIVALSALPMGALAACSDGSDAAGSADTVVTTTTVTTTTAKGDGSTSSLSAEEFVTEANAICSAGNQQIEAFFADVDPATGPSADQQQQLLDNVTQQVDDIEALGVPSDLDATVGQFVTEARTTIEQSRTTSPEEFFAAGNPFADLNTTAIAAGLTTCGS